MRNNDSDKRARSFIESKSASSGLHIALKKASNDSPASPYLGNPTVVDGLVRSFVGDICMRQAMVAEGEMLRDDAVETDKQRIRELAKIFCGLDSSYETIGEWNGEGLAKYAISVMRDYMSPDVDAMSVEKVLQQVFVLLVLEVYAAVQKYSDSGDMDEAKDRCDALVQDWTNLLLGIPPDE